VLQDELETILRRAVIGLGDGTINSDGLDTFRLGYELVRDEIGMRRESLKRQAGHDKGQAGHDKGQAGHDKGQAGHDDNVVIVKTAQSA